MEAQNQQLRAATADVLALASELRKGTIERVMNMSDLELGLQAAPRQSAFWPSLARRITLRAMDNVLYAIPGATAAVRGAGLAGMA